MELARHEAASDEFTGDWSFVRSYRGKTALVSLLAQMTNPRHIVEVGTFTGYTTLAVSLACPEALVQTFDTSATFIEFARKQWDAAYAANIRAYIGDAKVTLPKFAAPSIDFAYIDANKEDYLTYYELVMVRLRPGGVVVLDDTLWFGDVLLEHCVTPDGPHFQALNARIRDDARVEAVVLPAFANGLTICRRNS